MLAFDLSERRTVLRRTDTPAAKGIKVVGLIIETVLFYIVSAERMVNDPKNLLCLNS